MFHKNNPLQKLDNLQYNTLDCWVAGTNHSLTNRLMYQVLFFFIISSKILCKNPFNFFHINFTKMKIKSFESNPATHCFIFNLSKWYLDHQTLGRWDDQPSVLYWRLSDFKLIWVRFVSRFYRRNVVCEKLWNIWVRHAVMP